MASKFLLIKDFFNLASVNSYKPSLNIFLGQSALNRLDSLSLVKSLYCFMQRINNVVASLHVITPSLGKITASEIGIVANSFNFKRFRLFKSFLFLCGTDLDYLVSSVVTNDSFIVFQGAFLSSHITSLTNLVFPVPVYTEQLVTFVI